MFQGGGRGRLSSTENAVSWMGGGGGGGGGGSTSSGSNNPGRKVPLSSPLFTLKCTDLPQFDALLSAADQFRHDDKLHLRNLCNDTARCAGLTAIHTSRCSGSGSGTGAVGGGGANQNAGITATNNSFRPGSNPLVMNGVVMSNNADNPLQQQQQQQHHDHQPHSLLNVRKLILDYSRQRVTGETMELLYDLADAVGLTDRIKAMRTGQRINVTDDLPVLHHVLRMPYTYHNLSFSNEITTNVPQIQSSLLTTKPKLIQRQRSAPTAPTTTASSLSSSGNNHMLGGLGGGGGSAMSSFRQQSVGGYGNDLGGVGGFGGMMGMGGGGGGGGFAGGLGGIASSSSSGVGGGGGNSSTTSTIIRENHRMREQVRDFVQRVRSGAYKSVTGENFYNFLVVTTSMYAGVDYVATALQEGDRVADEQSEGYTLRFLTNIDPAHFLAATNDLDPCQTLVIVMNKNFSDSECMLNARCAKDWLVRGIRQQQLQDQQDNEDDEDEDERDNDDEEEAEAERREINYYSESEITQRHMIAVTCNATRCIQFGIAKDKIFRLWEWVSARFSVGGSAVGLLPLSLQFSYPVLERLLEGAHDMDEHFFHAPLRDNIPVILGLLGVWNSTFLGYSSRAVLPYSHALRKLPQYVQSVDMVSNAKRVALDGTPLFHSSAEINFGQAGTTCHSIFFQLLHQGRVVPVDFIGFMESSPQDIDLPGEAVSNHDELMSNFFAQPDALAYGKTLVDLIQEGAPEPLREHMVFTGNRPSSSLLFTKLDAYSIGQLIALYEHRTAVQGFIWGINSFDQYGLDLGKALVKTVRAQLSASRKTGASVQGFNYSTSNLLEHYLAHGKQLHR